MLDILETNVAPDFKVLLLPFTNATPPATTTWSNNLLTVTMADGQTDHIYFNTNADGRTRLAQYPHRRRRRGAGDSQPHRDGGRRASFAELERIAGRGGV